MTYTLYVFMNKLLMLVRDILTFLNYSIEDNSDLQILKADT